MSEFSEKHQYLSNILGRCVTIDTSPAGSFHNAGESNEPSWNFRLWKASLVLAKFIEEHLELVDDKVVIELGAGTGLLSIISTLLGARLTVCTDLKVALPLILHNAHKNLSKDCILYQSGEADVSSKGCSAGKCLKGHDVSVSLTESDEYICNICEEELSESEELFSCRECNFDFCHDCNEKIKDTSRHSELPTWLQCQLEAGESSGSISAPADTNTASNCLVITEFNWNDFRQYESIWRDLEAKKPFLVLDDCSTLVLASDVTYNLHAVQLFFSVMDSIVGYYKGLGKGDLSFVLAHHCRSEETTTEVLRQFTCRSSWAVREHCYDSNEQAIPCDGADVAVNAREIIIFSVTISLA